MTGPPEDTALKQEALQRMDKGYSQTFNTSIETHVREKTLHKTVKIVKAVEKLSETESKHCIKRGCHTVRNRSLNYIAILKQKHNVSYEIPLEKAKQIFQVELDIWDRTSLKAYFGTQPDVLTRVIQRRATYQTGTVSNKTIELRQKISKREGYLERLGLVNFEKRGNTWFMLLANNETIVPEIRHSQTRVYKRVEPQSIENFSLTPILEESEEARAEIKKREQREQREERECHRMREKSLSESHQKRTATSEGAWLTPTEQATIEDRDRKKLEILNRELLPLLERSAKNRGETQ